MPILAYSLVFIRSSLFFLGAAFLLARPVTANQRLLVLKNSPLAYTCNLPVLLKRGDDVDDDNDDLVVFINEFVTNGVTTYMLNPFDGPELLLICLFTPLPMHPKWRPSGPAALPQNR